MPLATRPNAKFEVVLSTDAHLPKKDRPVFVFRFLSCIEWEKIAALSDKFDIAGDAAAMLDLAFQVIKETLCNWRNMKTPSGKTIAYNFKRLKSLVSLAEATELMQAGVAQRPSVQDKKKFDLPSDLDTGKYVNPAPELINAETNPASQRRSRPNVPSAAGPVAPNVKKQAG